MTAITTAPAPARDATSGTAARPIRMLYIYPETLGPESEPERNALYHLSRYFEGDQIAVWIGGKPGMPQEAAHKPGVLGRFGFEWLPYSERGGPVDRFLQFVALVRRGLRLSRERGGYDVIVTYGVYRTGLAGLMVKWLTGSKLIVQFPSHPTRMWETEPGAYNRFKERVAPFIVRFISRYADHLHLMYPTSLEGLVEFTPEEFARKVSAFPDFTPVALVPQAAPGATEPYAMFVGYPWRRKGVDLLIRAWKMIAPKFPGYTVKIIGFAPDLPYWERMRGDDPSIEFMKPQPHATIVRLMSRASMFVLPSRCEGVARVMVEAMAAGIPVVTTSVDGHPFHVRDGETGMLVAPENVEELAAKMERVLGDRAFAARVAKNGSDYARRSLSEEQYVEHFRGMAERTIRG